RASVAGVVSAVDVTEGSRVTRGQRLAQITDPSDVRVVVEVAVSDVGALKKGMKGELEAAGSEEPFPVEVVGVSPYVDPGTGTATAELRLVREKKSTPLPPGLVGKVRF